MLRTTSEDPRVCAAAVKNAKKAYDRKRTTPEELNG